MSAPQVTPADVEAAIASEHYFTAGEGVIGAFVAGEFGAHGGDTVAVRRDIASPEVLKPSLNLLTFCVLVLKNGHIVSGEAYCADPAKFNAETGRIEARKAAINKLWPMVVYAERERLLAKSLRFLPLVRSATSEQLAELREAVRNAPSMPLVLEPIPGITWMAIDPTNPATLPEKGYWLVTVDSDDGREVHVLWHSGDNKWLHDGEYTFQHGYHFRPIAWAPRPDGYTGEVLE